MESATPGVLMTRMVTSSYMLQGGKVLSDRAHQLQCFGGDLMGREKWMRMAGLWREAREYGCILLETSSVVYTQ